MGIAEFLNISGIRDKEGWGVSGIAVIKGVILEVQDSQEEGEEELVAVIFTQEFIYEVDNFAGAAGEGIAFYEGVGYPHEKGCRDASA